MSCGARVGWWRRGSCRHSVLEVRDAGRLDGPDLLELHLRVPEVVEEASTVAEQHWNNVELKLVQQSRCQVLLSDVAAAPKHDVFAASGLPCLFERGPDSVGDEVERGPSFHLHGVTREMGEDEHRVVVGRVVAPPAHPLFVAPGSTVDRAEHVPAHHPSADVRARFPRRTLRGLANRLERLQGSAEGFPSPPLAAHVLCWSVHRIDARSGSYVHRSAPNGSAELVCEVGGQPLLVGPQTAPLVRKLSPGATIVLLRLRPESAAAVLGTPAYELADQVVALEDVLPATRFLGERIATEPARAVAALEGAVSAQLARGAASDRMVAFCVARLIARATRVSSVAASLFVSERQLRRRFKAAVGVSPKALERVLRFQRFLALVHSGGWSRFGLARTAAALGYADQAHLTRECVRLSGLPPAELIRQSDLHCRGRHDHSPSFRALLGTA